MEMFFLPAELVKEAGNEVLSHRMENLGTSQDVSFTLCHVSQFSFLTILKVGSPKPKLHSEAVALYTLCKQYQIHLEPEWPPREFNQEGDESSRLASKDNYMPPWIFCGDRTQ